MGLRDCLSIRRPARPPCPCRVLPRLRWWPLEVHEAPAWCLGLGSVFEEFSQYLILASLSFRLDPSLHSGLYVCRPHSGLTLGPTFGPARDTCGRHSGFCWARASFGRSVRGEEHDSWGWTSELEKEAFALQHRSLSESPKVEDCYCPLSPAGKLILRVLGSFVF